MVDFSENEIMGKWEDSDTPLVSIRCLTYNHEKYIADALDSFLSQRTTFPFEIVVHDDASTDNTPLILQEYQRKFPHIVLPIYEQENKYSVDIEYIIRLVNEKMRGKYIAMCEGDDYWIDPLKLQKQFEAMEKNPMVDICTHAVKIINSNTNSTIGVIQPSAENTIIPVEKVILGGGGYVGTSSILYRKSLDIDEPLFRTMCRYDYTLQVYGSLRGGMLYLAECMSIYRFMNPGSWSLEVVTNEKKEIERTILWDQMLDELNKETEGKYQKEIRLYQKQRAVDFNYRFRHYRNLKNYRDIYREFKGKMKYTYFLKVNAPRLYCFLQSTRNFLQRREKV